MNMKPKRQPATPAPRIHVMLARSAPIGVILRRGPALWVRLAVWHTTTDAITLGQWFHGRVYEERCDVSPDGSLIIYFAAKHWRRSVPSCWTAISRPPYFTALQLWSRTDTWAGGGYFEDERTVRVDQCDPCGLKNTPLHFIVNEYCIWSDKKRRFRLSGWNMRENPPDACKGRGPRQTTEFARASRDGRFRLVRQERDGFGQSHRYHLVHRKSGMTIDLPVATWADWDHRGRLTFASKGKLLAAEIAEDGIEATHEIADFNNMKPENVPAPDWATRW